MSDQLRFPPGGSRKTGALLQLLVPFKRELWLLVAISAVINLLMLLPTIYMLQIFDRVMVSKNVMTLLFLSLIVGALYGLQAFSEWMRTKTVVATGIRIDMAINAPLFGAIFEDRLAQAKSSPNQALSDLTTLRQWLTGSGINAFLDAPWIPLYVILMFILHPVLGWLTIFFICFLLVFAFFAMYRNRALSEASVEEEKELNDFIFNKLRNAEVLEAQGMVPHLQRRWWGRQIELVKLQHQAFDMEERITSVSKQLKFGMNSFGLGAGALLAMQGELTMGAMIAASMLMGRATAPVDSLVFGWKGLLIAKSAFGRLEELLSRYDMPPKVVRGASQMVGESRLPDGAEQKFDFTLDRVSVNLGKLSEPVLKNMSLSIREARCTVLVGPSGAGKSTLAKLLVGVLRASQGKAMMGNVRLEDIDRGRLASHLGYLPQEVELFADTIASNIARLGKPNPDLVVEAARAVGIHDFVLALPNGYDTVVGGPGGVLSGGQRQRIALARTVYGDPNLLVLDEPNSNLDEMGESALASVIESFKRKGATILLVSHRQAALKLADDVVELVGGELRFMGSRDAYLSNSSGLHR